MSNLHNERYDEIKSLLKKSRMLFEQSETDFQINMGQDIQDKINQDTEYETATEPISSDKETTKKDKTQKYRISGGILALHGKNRGD